MNDTVSRTTDSSCDVITLLPSRIMGLGFTAFSSLISLLAVIFLVCKIAWKYRVNSLLPPSGQRALLQTNLVAYMLQLLFGEVIMSISGIIDAKWAIEQRVYCGIVCIVQGATNIIGVTSVAGFTLLVTLHTWWVIYYNRGIRYNPMLWVTASGAVWLYVVLFVIIGYFVKLHEGKDFFDPSPLWCFIAQEFTIERLLGQYLWVWITGLGGIFFYTQLFLFARGRLSFNNDRYWPWSLDWKSPPVPLDDVRALAWKMLMYPASYTVLTLGLSVTRWAGIGNDIHLADHSDAAAGTLFSRFLLRLSGLVTVALILTTPPNILLLRHPIGNEASELQE